jgi:hypothetical protein
MLTPVLARFDKLDERLDASDERLAQLGRRLDELELQLETTGARLSAMTEQSLTYAESEARTKRRLEAVETLLGARAGER